MPCERQAIVKEGINNFPAKDIVLKTEKGEATYQKTDVYRGIMWYTYISENMQNIYPVPVDRVQEIIVMNEKGQKPDDLISFDRISGENKEYMNDVGQESLTRFEKKNQKNRKYSKKSGRKSRENI